MSSSNNLLLVWPTTPGVRYEVLQSTNLQSWSTVPGYPAPANGPVQQMPFATVGAAGFFQVGQLDEQPPAIVSQSPPDGAFAVSRFSDLTMQLSDATGINTNSILLIVGNLGTFTLTNAQLTYSNGVLTFLNAGPLSDYGTDVQVTLIVADALGNVGTNTWTFTLEVQPQVATNLFVFGSSQAQGMGQRIGNIPTAALAKRSGPIPLIPPPNPWALVSVESNCLVLSYTNTVPNFVTNTYVCNLTPATTNEIFYRQIIAISNNPVKMLLTLFTTNIPLAEIMPEGSASLSSDSVIYNFDSNGTLKPAFSGNATFTFPTLGEDLSGETIFDEDGVALTLDEGYWLFTPSLQISLETHLFALQRLDVEFEGDMSSALVPELSFSGALKNDVPIELGSYDNYIFLGVVPPGLPIWVDVNFDLQAQLGYNVSASATMSTGAEEDGNVTLGVQYNKDVSPSVSPISTVNFPPPTIVPFTYTINGSASAYAQLVPEVSARVESLAGVELNVNPKVTIDGQATYSDGQLTSANWAITADAYLTLGLSVVGVNDSDLPSLVYQQLFFRQWSSSYPQANQLTIQSQPQSENVVLGNSASFSVSAVANQPISYQWYFNGIPLPGQTSQTLLLSSVILGYAGNYSVRVTTGNQVVYSVAAVLTIFGTAPLSTITFDDLANTATGLSVPNGYCAFNWYNVGYLNARTNNYNPSGYPSAMQSPNNVAFNWSGTPAAMYVSKGTFDLISADLTAAWNDNLQVMVLGYRNSTMIYSNTYILSAISPTPVNFNYFGVTEVDFDSSGGTQHSGYSTSGEQFAIDNITATTNSAIAAPSSVTTFDDLPTPDIGANGYGVIGSIPANYSGVSWNNFWVVDAADYPLTSGYQPGMISPKNVAFNGFANPASISSAVPFNFVSAYLTAAWNDNLQVEVEGYSGNTLLYDNIYTLSATSPTFINFNYQGVTEVYFSAFGGTLHPGYSSSGEFFAMDNVTIATIVTANALQTSQTMTKAGTQLHLNAAR